MEIHLNDPVLAQTPGRISILEMAIGLSVKFHRVFLFSRMREISERGEEATTQDTLNNIYVTSNKRETFSIEEQNAVKADPWHWNLIDFEESEPREISYRF